MDWTSINFDWNRTRAFLVTAEEGSLSAAARALNTTQPTLGRQVAALESELGVVLFERVGKRLLLTPGGLDLLEQVRAMGNAAAQISLMASGQSEQLEGLVTISASELYGTYLLPPVVQHIRAAEPGIEIEIVASNAESDLSRREADIAIRNFQPTQSELIAKKIGEHQARLYAATSYLERSPAIQSIEDLSQHQFIGFDRSDMLINGLAELGLILGHQHFPLISANQSVQLQLVQQGLGIGILPDSIASHISGIQRLPLDAPVVSYPLWLTAHRELRYSRRIRFVYDQLAKGLGQPGVF